VKVTATGSAPSPSIALHGGTTLAGGWLGFVLLANPVSLDDMGRSMNCWIASVFSAGGLDCWNQEELRANFSTQSFAAMTPPFQRANSYEGTSTFRSFAMICPAVDR
jgi:hypothetical protein